MSVEEQARSILDRVEGKEGLSPLELWTKLSFELKPSDHFDVHEHLYNECYKEVKDIKPCWIPSAEDVEQTNIAKMMKKLNFKTYEEFYAWSVDETTRSDFWQTMIDEVGIDWAQRPSGIFHLEEDSTASPPKLAGVPHATYLPDGKLNIASSCFKSHSRGRDEPALLYAMESAPAELQSMTYAVLDRLSNQIANAIKDKLKLDTGDAIGICMPMTPESVAIYLGIIKAGCVVISIADSFSAQEIETRCRLGGAKAIFTQDVIYRGAKFLPLYNRLKEHPDMGHLLVVVVPGMLHAGPYPKLSQMKRSPSGTWDDKDEHGEAVQVHGSVVSSFRPGLDFSWHEFLHHCSDEFEPVVRNSMDPCNILFSSGTTGEPKAIVWSHSTPIKCAIDGFLHQDVREGENVVWPTNIGWMMGPFLLFQLINGATIGIFNGITSTDAFCKYVQAANMNMVGVIPSLVKAWQASGATDRCDWSCVRRFSSTGEASDPKNMLWLMSRVPGYAPVVEYCGGTEIGGSYMSSVLVQPNVPSMFSSPVCGSQLVLLDVNGKMQKSDGYAHSDVTNKDVEGCVGELTLVPPCLGLSTHLLNRDHYTCYYGDMPSGDNGECLRRHGDEVEVVRESKHVGIDGVDGGVVHSYYRALGRCDDTMNLGGIKISSVEIERACNLADGVLETAAVAVNSPGGGPSLLVMYVVAQPIGPQTTDKSTSTVFERLRTISGGNGGEISSPKDKEKENGSGLGPPLEVPTASVSETRPPVLNTEEVDALKKLMQLRIKSTLNPLFHIYKAIVVEKLPRTASNKIMRRVLRDEYMQAQQALEK